MEPSAAVARAAKMSRCCLPEPKPWRRILWLLALPLVPTGAAAASVGPSFACPAHDPLAQRICARPDLAALDLAFVQTYQALRQQSPDPRRSGWRPGTLRTSCAGPARCRIGKPACGRPIAQKRIRGGLNVYYVVNSQLIRKATASQRTKVS